MKKITKIIFFTILFFTSINISNASSNYLVATDEIDNVRLHLKTADIEKDITMFKIINIKPNSPIYSLEPLKDFGAENYNDYVNIAKVDIDISEEKWSKISEIAFFGYSYRDRTDIKWYIACQYMIWESMLEGKGEIYFIDEFNNKIEPYQNEIATIKHDVDNIKLLPTFVKTEFGAADYYVHLNEDLTLIDNNNILNEFIINGDEAENIIRTKNSLTVHYSSYGDKIITYYVPMESNLNMPKIFYSNTNLPALISRGTVTLAGGATFIKVVYPSLTIWVKPSELTSLSREGFTYDLYDNFDYLLGTFETNSEGIITVSEIVPGNYYLKAKNNAYGFQLNQDKIEFEVTTEDCNIEFEEELIKKTITLNSNISTEYKIYNVDAKEEIFINGDCVTIDLPYGNYIISQTHVPENYDLASSFEIIINEDSKDLTFTFENKELVKEENPPENSEKDQIEKDNTTEENSNNSQIENGNTITEKPIKDEEKEDNTSTNKPIANESSNDDLNSSETKEDVSSELKKEPIKDNEENSSVKKDDTIEPDSDNLDKNGTLSNTIENNQDNSIPIKDLSINNNDRLIIDIPSTGSNTNLELIILIGAFFIYYGIFKKI